MTDPADKLTDVALPVGMRVERIESKLAARLVVDHHYLHRKPPISHAFGLYWLGKIVGVVTYGTPASRHLQMSACPTDPSHVIELNRLWVHDKMPKNTESWFVSRSPARPDPAHPRIVPHRLQPSRKTQTQGQVLDHNRQ